MDTRLCLFLYDSTKSVHRGVYGKHFVMSMKQFTQLYYFQMLIVFASKSEITSKYKEKYYANSKHESLDGEL